jgi:hypothetical protein
MKNLDAIHNHRERKFARSFFDHSDWEHHPGPYRLAKGDKYIPDFKDKRRGILIEVVGSRQAYTQNKEKYARFQSEHPDKPLEFRNSRGEKLEPSKGHLFYKTGERRNKKPIKDANETVALQKIKSLGGYQVVAEKIGVDASTVFRHLQGRKPTLENVIKYKDLGIVPEDFIEKNETAKQETDQ